LPHKKRKLSRNILFPVPLSPVITHKPESPSNFTLTFTKGPQFFKDISSIDCFRALEDSGTGSGSKLLDFNKKKDISHFITEKNKGSNFVFKSKRFQTLTKVNREQICRLDLE
jgi:hypothetical protein